MSCTRESVTFVPWRICQARVSLLIVGAALIGRNLRHFREISRLSQEDLAGRSSMATRTLQRLEAGEGNPTIETLEALAGVLGVDVSDLIAPSKKSRSKTPDAPELPDVYEAIRLLTALQQALPVRKLSALYLLTKDEIYLDQLAALPGVAPIAQLLKKLP